MHDLRIHREKSPCRANCPDRTRGDESPNCHTVCKRYLDFKKALEEDRAGKVAEHKGYREYVDYKWRKRYR